MKRLHAFFAVCALTCAFAWEAWADILKLQNGDIISGTIISMDEETVTIRTAYGTMDVDRNFITEGTFSGGSDIAREGLILELTFDTGFKDTSGSGRTVENPGGVAPTPRDASDTDRYFKSDGTGQYVVIKDPGDLGAMQVFTVAFRVIIEDAEKSQYIISKWNQSSGSTADGKFALNYRAGVLSLYVVDSTGTFHLVQHKQALPSGRWMDVAMVCTAEKISIYIGGTLALEHEDALSGFFTDTNPVYLMTAPASTANRFGYYNVVGGIDDVRIFNRALGADEISALASGF